MNDHKPNKQQLAIEIYKRFAPDQQRLGRKKFRQMVVDAIIQELGLTVGNSSAGCYFATAENIVNHRTPKTYVSYGVRSTKASKSERLAANRINEAWNAWGAAGESAKLIETGEKPQAFKMPTVTKWADVSALLNKK